MNVQVVSPRILAAVRRKVAIGDVGTVWRPALDQVWSFLRTQPDLQTDGHNIFLYHHPARRGDPMDVDFGVEVVREFAPSGDVQPVKTPANRGRFTATGATTPQSSKRPSCIYCVERYDASARSAPTNHS